MASYQNSYKLSLNLKTNTCNRWYQRYTILIYFSDMSWNPMDKKVIKILNCKNYKDVKL